MMRSMIAPRPFPDTTQEMGQKKGRDRRKKAPAIDGRGKFAERN